MTTPTVQPVYATPVAVTFTSLNSLATSSTFVAGAEATAISNSANLYADGKFYGTIFVGTTPTINTQILLYVFDALDNTPTWPDVFDGTDSAETLTSVGVGQGFLKWAATLQVDATTSDRGYPFSFAVAELFGGIMPRDFNLFATHNTGVNLKSTGHSVKFQGIHWALPSV